MNLMQLKIIGIASLCGVSVGYFLLPHKTKVEMREVTKTVTQEVVKVKNNTVTKVVTVKSTDGTETTTTDIVDTGTINADINSSNESSKEKIVTSNGVSVGVYALSTFKLTKPDFGLLLDVPVASKVSVFATGDTGKRVGLGLRFQF